MAAIMRDKNHVATFLAEHRRAVEITACVFAVDHLAISERLTFGDVLLLPADDELIPDEPEIKNVEGLHSFIRVPCSGTSVARMVERARAGARYTLDVLRVALSQEQTVNSLHPRQLRFRVGEVYVFAGQHVGWQAPDDAAYGLTLNRATYELLMQKPVARIASEHVNDVHRQARLAMNWINRSFNTSDRLVAMVFLFTALEALLGDRKEGLKAPAIAFRRTMLSHVVRGSWTAPETIYRQYDEVRSTAVHGSPSPDVTEKAARSFGADVIRALDEYLTFAATGGFTKRSALRAALESHPDAPAVLERLRERDPYWNAYRLPGSE
jgi:hypothetical protein